MLIACVRVPHFPIAVERRGHPDLAGRACLVAGAGVDGRRVVVDASDGLLGVAAGMPLSQALSRAVEAVVIEADMPRYRAAFERLLDILQGVGPDVEAGDLSVAYLRLDGLTTLYGGLDGTLRAVLHAVPASLAPRVGAGHGKRLAYLASWLATESAPFVLPRVAADVLAPHSVGLLPVAWAMKQRMLRFGLTTLGQVAALPLSAMQAQFGLEGRLAWELSRGVDRSTFVPRQPEVVVRESLAFPDPVTGAGPLLLALETLLGRAFVRTEIRGKYARVCALEAAVFRRAPWTKRVVFKEPAGSRTQAYAMLRRAVDGVTLPGAAEGLTLTLSGIVGEAGRQESFFSDVRAAEGLRQAIATVEAMHAGATPLYVVREIEPWSRIPERRYGLVPYRP